MYLLRDKRIYEKEERLNMMEGIEILATEEVAIAWESFNWHNFWVAVIAGICFGLMFSIIAGLVENDNTLALVLFIIMSIVSVFFGIAIGKNTGEPIEYKTQYQVLVDESVSMAEFYEKYEIIDQNGKIYTIEEKINE